MIYEKRYLQFNSLVFDGYDMISDFDEDISFKGDVQDYSYGNGGYMPFKSQYIFAETKSANMTITIRLNKVPCEYRKFYVQFAEEELSKVGKLWAVKNNEIIWTNAFVKNRTPVITGRQEYVEWDVEFVIPSGVWNKADKQKTFLVPYDPCTMMECKGYMEVNPCGTDGCTDCCRACQDIRELELIRHNTECTCCCEGALTQDMQLCYHSKDIENLYGCERAYQLVYDCESADKFTKERFIGQKICAKTCDNMIAGQFYSETDLPTDDVTIIIDGKMKNPEITINDTTNVIQGEYDGSLIINSSGDVYYETECCEPKILDPSVWTIPANHGYGWTVYPRMNSLIVNLNNCCADEHLNCVYIQAQGITA